MPANNDNRKLDQHVHINDPSDSYISYETNGIASREELEERLELLIRNHDIVFRGPSATYEGDKWVEVSFYKEWTGKRKLVMVKGINGSEIASADARHKKGGIANKVRPGNTRFIEVVEEIGIWPILWENRFEYAIEMAGE